jgi:acetoin utilization deacetylase AcuC-like enzyme
VICSNGPMKFFYSDIFAIPLPEEHRFPGSKYLALREALLADGTLAARRLHVSPGAPLADLTAAHEVGYVGAVLGGRLGHKEMRQIGLPWSEALARRAVATMGGAIEAARSALATGFSAQLSGGTHHAHAAFGSGYCIFNDFAIVALKALREGWAERIAIVDLDVHQGDGNAALLGGRDDVFILDLYCEKNFPFHKGAPHLGVPLPPRADDRSYLAKLAETLPAVVAFRPGLVLYQAGVDPLRQDALGHLDLSHDGLAARDRLVFETFHNAGIPLMVCIGGGYSRPISLSVEAHANTFRVAKSVFGF